MVDDRLMFHDNRLVKVNWLVVFVGSLLCACTTPNPAASCADGTCSDPAFGFCDVDGAVSGEPASCIAISCTPGEVVACRGDQSLVCNATGNDLELVVCSYGSCTSDPTPHCPYLEPVYLPDVCDEPAAQPILVISNSSTFDTDLDLNCNGGVVRQAGGPEICIVRYRSIAIDTGVELTVTGTRALALVADEELRMDGILDLSASARVNGPGGGVIVSGGREGNGTGGGGAGFKTAGGSGGNESTDGGSANGGPASMNPAELPALVGGTRSQAATPETNNSGGAGGVATLISCRKSVNVSGLIDAGGGGGLSGGLVIVVASGGCGGGSGGYVVLQGMDVSVSGQVFANGGGGGGGKPSNAQKGDDGGDAPRSTDGGFGGLPQSAGDGAGGSGGSITSLPRSGKRSTDPAASAGGGGGSMGFFQSYTPAGVTPTLTPSTASPAFEENRTVGTR